MRSLVLALALPVVACSSSKKAVTGDAPEAVDAAACPGQASYTLNDNSNGEIRCIVGGFYDVCPAGPGANTTFDPQLIIVGANYNAQDSLEIDLYNGGAPFVSGYAMVTNVDLSAQADFHTCGACVLVDVGLNPQTNKFTDQYLAKSGSLNITAVAPASSGVPQGHVTGNISNVTLVHTLINTSTNTSMTIDDGCSITIPSATFDTDLDNPAGFTGGGDRLRVKIPR